MKCSSGKKSEIEKTKKSLLREKSLHNQIKLKHVEVHSKILIKNKKAWMLIKEAGCTNFKEGDAEISQKHCNFFVNNGKARSKDIENLMKKVQKKVYEKTGVNLELEIKIIGEILENLEEF